MAGLHLVSNDGSIVTRVSLPDGEGSAVVGKRTYRWTFHKYLGPTFLRADGEILKNQPGENHPVWPRFEKWLDEQQNPINE
jgi:hypothetical protein